MTFPTVEVTVNLATITGVPCAGVVITAKLDQNDAYSGGIVVSKPVTETTDEDGIAVFELFPNHPDTGLGTVGTVYKFSASIPGGKNFHCTAQIPNAACDIQDVMDIEAAQPSAISWAALRAAFSQVLTTNLTLWVRTDGDDSNDGSANDADHAFETLQYAYSVACTLVYNGECEIAIRMGLAGTYAPLDAWGLPGGNPKDYISVLGLGTSTCIDGLDTPAAIRALNGAKITVGDLRIKNSSLGLGGHGLVAVEGGIINLSTGVIFDECLTGAHIGAFESGGIYAYNSYSIVGGADNHMETYEMSWIEGGSCTVTITGTPHCNTFIYSGYEGYIFFGPVIFDGTTTGLKAYIDRGGALDGAGIDFNYYPGSTPVTFGPGGGRYGNHFMPASGRDDAGIDWTVAQLPPANERIVGLKMFVGDLDVPALGNFGAAAVGGGTNRGPVTCYGGALGWRIG